MRIHAPARPPLLPRLALGLGLLLGALPLAAPPAEAQRRNQPVTAQQPEAQRQTIGRDGPEAAPLVQQDRRSEAERAAANRPMARRVEMVGNPTTALFAAINAGEIDAVREAVAAGGDVLARNILGLTPIDLAIDLGRNDIAFYLMSQRRGGSSALDGGGEAMLDSGGSATRDPRAARAAREAQARADREARAARERERREAARQAAEARRAGGRAPLPDRQGATPAAARTTTQFAPLWTGDGGAARPDAGFLGFNASRPAGARPPPGGIGPRSVSQGTREPAPRMGRAWWPAGAPDDAAERRRLAAERRAREAHAREQRAAAREARSGRVGTTSPAAGPRPASLPGTRTAPRSGVEAESLPPAR
ncbi:MAG: ankyrin repeat domain-containing protein [Alphaproteobacteria bacterium]|nr:ankyrin repeat domain-containing protein [Alphaproteobacteria bacterium]